MQQAAYEAINQFSEPFIQSYGRVVLGRPHGGVNGVGMFAN